MGRNRNKNKSNKQLRTVKVLEEKKEQITTFKALGLDGKICKVCKKLGWNGPTKIQREAIPHALKGEDVIGLAETGSGKTAAFALPVIQDYLKKQTPFMCLVLTPTRELAEQIVEHFQNLGSEFGLGVCSLIGGQDSMVQFQALAKMPHVIVGTPGRVAEHLEKTRGFSLDNLRFLVLDEADRILDMDFEEEVMKIVRKTSKSRRTYLYSATMTSKVWKLQRASLKNPVKIEVCKKFQTVNTLEQYYVFVQSVLFKNSYLAQLLETVREKSIIIFCNSRYQTLLLSIMLRQLDYYAVPLHGEMNQNKRLEALEQFKSRVNAFLLATDVAARGLDIPTVDVVINFDIPTSAANYVHRVGRTARAGRPGLAISLVLEYDVSMFKVVEEAIKLKLEKYPKLDEDRVYELKNQMTEVEKLAKNNMRTVKEALSKDMAKRKSADNDEDDKSDTEEAPAVRKTIKKKLKTK